MIERNRRVLKHRIETERSFDRSSTTVSTVYLVGAPKTRRQYLRKERKTVAADTYRAQALIAWPTCNLFARNILWNFYSSVLANLISNFHFQRLWIRRFQLLSSFVESRKEQRSTRFHLQFRIGTWYLVFTADVACPERIDLRRSILITSLR